MLSNQYVSLMLDTCFWPALYPPTITADKAYRRETCSGEDYFMTVTSTFTNQELSSDSLAPPASMKFEPLSPAYKKMCFVSALVVTISVIALNLVLNLLATGSLQAVMSSFGAMIAGGFLLLTVALGLTLPNLLWRSKGYQLREHDLHYRRGIIWHRVTSLPYIRVQHVELESGPVERYFKLATLKFYTAGGGSADMKIPGLPFATASKIRSYVMARVGANGDDQPVSDSTPGNEPADA
jgi:membrane protein YdbS with pleckstrin-like domain